MKSESSRSAKRHTVKHSSTSAKSEADWAKLEEGAEGEPTREHPEANIDHIARGIVREGLRPPAPKVPVSIRVDEDVLVWFKAQGPGYQTRMNAVLRAFRDASV